jgi:probable HAF family extracellular repeat protein
MTTYTFTPIFNAFGLSAIPSGINDADQIVGNAIPSSGNLFLLYSPFSPNGGIGGPSNTGTTAYGINDSDEFVGSYTNSSGLEQGFVRNSGTYFTLNDPLGTKGTVLTGIDNAGAAVGYYFDSSGAAHGFIFDLAFATLNGPAGATRTKALGINDAGQIIGDYIDSSGGEHSFLYSVSSGNYTTLNDPSAASTETFARGINDAGEIVGDYVDSSGTQHGFLDIGGVYTTIDNALGGSTTLTGINNAGQITGYYTDVNGAHSFLATPPPPTTYGISPINPPMSSSTHAYGINDLGEISGYYTDTSDADHSFISNGTTTTALVDPNAAVNRTDAQGINNFGQVVGYYYDSSNVVHAFMYSVGGYTTIDDPSGAGGSQAYGINDAFQVVGGYTDFLGKEHGFLYSGGSYTPLSGPAGATFSVAFGINDAGQIVGGYEDGSGIHGFLYSSGSYITLNDPLSNGTTVAFGINDAGQIVGGYSDSSGAEHGFIYSGGTYTPFNLTGLFTGISLASINDAGEIVGTYDNGQFSFSANPEAVTTTTPPPPTSVQQEVLGLYAALYNRAADFPGYSFWVGMDGQQSDSGGVTVANAGTTAVTLNDAQVLGQGFVNTQATFFNQTYASLTDSQFINALYVNIGGNAGDPGGVAYWQGLLAQAEGSNPTAAQIQAARAGLVGQFVHDLIDFDLTPGAAALGLTAAQYQQAQTREAAINDKIAVSLGYSNISQQTGGSILVAHTVGDAAYDAAVAVIGVVTSDPGTVTAAILGINTAVAAQNLHLI